MAGAYRQPGRALWPYPRLALVTRLLTSGRKDIRNGVRRRPYSHVLTSFVRKGSEKEFLSLWHHASEWVFVNGHSPRSWYLIRDPDNPQLFRNLTLWPTGTTEEDIASDPSAAEFLQRCAPHLHKR